MAKVATVVVAVKVNVKLTFWSAIKLRIAGKYIPEMRKFLYQIQKLGRSK